MTLVSTLMGLKDKVQKATARVGDAPGRPVPLFWTRSFSWAPSSMPTEQFASMGNYAPGEVRIHSMGVQVDWGSSLTNIQGTAFRLDSGYLCGTSGNQPFDFEWNLKYNSSGAQYGVTGHTDVNPYLSSEVFRGEGVGTRFDVSPLRLGLNESVEIRIRPVTWRSPAAFVAFVVRFQMWGTRSYV